MIYPKVSSIDCPMVICTPVARGSQCSERFNRVNHDAVDAQCSKWSLICSVSNPKRT